VLAFDCRYWLKIIDMKLRFSIRDLLWLTLVVGLCVGWWIDHRRYSRYSVIIVEDSIRLVDHNRVSEILIKKPRGFGP
jgi:hypothetical protein